ncbi:MAG TPA: hypothetical protein VFD35_14965, partial [Pricia sp.]|nr:hypothetical protein [Pricia sp.]
VVASVEAGLAVEGLLGGGNSVGCFHQQSAIAVHPRNLFPFFPSYRKKHAQAISFSTPFLLSFDVSIR